MNTLDIVCDILYSYPKGYTALKQRIADLTDRIGIEGFDFDYHGPYPYEIKSKINPPETPNMYRPRRLSTNMRKI